MRLHLSFAPLLVLSLAGCAGTAPMAPLDQTSFAQYRSDTVRWIEQRRDFVRADHADELAWNAPAEWRPAGAPRGAVLLLHGLGDSPFSFSDLGATLAAQGYLVRAVLLPGHGTRPADMLPVTLDDWRRLVRQQTALLKQEGVPVWLGGFSTGANLAVDYALDDADVRGLLLFSPAFKTSVDFDWAAPYVKWVKPWLRAPDAERPQQTPVRYLNMPTNGFAQFYASSSAVRHKLRARPFDRPVLFVSAAHDSVVDVDLVRDTFAQRFTHPSSRMIWYGELPAEAAHTPRLLVRPDRLPELRISQFSHMGVLFSPANAQYGSAGMQRLCSNGQAAGAQRRCETGAPVWYADWGYREPGKTHARLTFNPYYDWQAGVMLGVLGHADGQASN